jgi:hypothetical protein
MWIRNLGIKVTKETIDDWIEPEPVEFDCGGCGREIVGISMYKLQPYICGACLSYPGWVDDAELCHALDPFNDRNPAIVSLSAEEVECRGEILAAILRYFHHRVRIIEDAGDTIEQNWDDRPILQ